MMMVTTTKMIDDVMGDAVAVDTRMPHTSAMATITIIIIVINVCSRRKLQRHRVQQSQTMTLNKRVAQLKDDNRCATLLTTMHCISFRLNSLITTSAAVAMLHFHIHPYGAQQFQSFANCDLSTRFCRKNIPKKTRKTKA